MLKNLTWQTDCFAADLVAALPVFNANALPVVQRAQRTDDLQQALPVAETLMRDVDSLVVCGIGGSALGASALLGAQAPMGKPVHVCDDLDVPIVPSAGYLLVSKSGRTAETLTQAYQLQHAGVLRGRAAVITDPGDNPLRRLALHEGLPVIDHPPEIGGRFSVLTVAGLVAAFCAGIDPFAVRAAAVAVLDQVDTIVQSATLLASAENNGVRSHVFWTFGRRYTGLGAWDRQLWAESMGKQGKGSALLAAVGPADRHSQQQLWLDGPRTETHTFLFDAPDPGVLLPVIHDPDMAYLSERRTGDVLAACRIATFDTLRAAGIRTRTLVPPADATPAQVCGGFFMWRMLETIVAAQIFGINPYDQPAVEDGKRRAAALLAAGSG